MLASTHPHTGLHIHYLDIGKRVDHLPARRHHSPAGYGPAETAPACAPQESDERSSIHELFPVRCPLLGPGEHEGICGCLLPTFTSDLKGINERAIRHDIAREKELGISGALLVAECGTTFDELLQVTEIAVDEAAGGLQTVVHAVLPTLEDNIALVRESERLGADVVLVSYPLTYYPKSEEEVFEYTRAIAESTNLGIIVFAMHLWNFRRFHPSHFSPDLIGRMINEIPNVVAVKTEVGGPGVGGIAQIFERYRNDVIVMDPIESNSPAWHAAYGMQWMGTSNYEPTARGSPATST